MVWLLLVVFVLLQIADVWTTNKVLARGGREKNPIVRFLMRLFGQLWWVPKLILTIGCGLYLAVQPWPEGPLWLVFIIVLYAWVVWSNLRQFPAGRLLLERLRLPCR